jgi:exodeoxyribonuclease V gamma subunit
LTLADLHQLVRQPVEVFFKSRLRVRLDSVDEMDPLEEPFALNGLEQYQAGQQLLAANATPQAMERLTLSGQLPMAAFGARMASELHTKAQAVLERQAPWAQRYPHTLPAQSIALTVDGVAITGTLEGLRSGHDGRGGEERPPPDNEGASWLQLNQRTGAVLEGDADAPAARGHIICRLWVNHVLGCASGMPLTSVQLGLDGEVALRPLPQPEALAIVRRLLAVYRAAWERPLPVACKTGWAYVRAQLSQQHAATHHAGKEPKDPHEAAQAIFDGGHHRPGEHAESAYLARAFETYEDIESELPQWAELLYGELFEHTRPTQPSHLAESAAA